MARASIDDASPGETASDEFEDGTLLQAADEEMTGENDHLLPSVPSHLARQLYVSHFLSTWNSRLFEFGAVLFLASVFPDTLLPMSIYALVRSGSAIIFSQALGSWIDRGERLVVVRTSIIGQRLAVAASCALFWILLLEKNMQSGLKTILFAITIIFACVEKLCSVLNLVSIERDWV